MKDINVAIVYYSSTGTNYKMANWAKEEVEGLGANVRLVKVPELAPEEAIAQNPAWKEHYDQTQDIPEAGPEDLEWADAIIWSVPTRFGVMASQMKQFIDMQGGLWGSGKTVNKVVTAMSSASNAHGGQEATILSLYTAMYHWGAIVVAPGYTDDSIFAAGGNPYGTSVTVDGEGKMVEDVEGAVKHQAKRVVDVAAMLKKGNN